MTLPVAVSSAANRLRVPVACSHASAVRLVPGASGAAAGIGPAPESGSSRRRTKPARVQAATDKAPRCRAPSRQQGISGELEGLGAMGLKVESVPDGVDRRRREPGGSRHRAQAPVRRSPRRRLKRLANDLGDLVIADLARRAGTGLVTETLDPMLCKPRPPFAHGVGRSPDPQADGLVLLAFRGQKDDARPLGQPLRRLPSRRQTLEFAPLALGKMIGTAILPMRILRPR
jgi:hypothetical protein